MSQPKDFGSFVVVAGPVASNADLTEASACLDRFTAAFNACDPGAMDDELYFPHIMLSGAERLEWSHRRSLPPRFFDDLRATGWRSTRYESKTPVLSRRDKVHYVVCYSRLAGDGSLISTHENLWIVVRVANRWAISLRSY